MSDLSTVTLLDGNVYTIKDAIRGVEFIVGTQAASTGSWTGVTNRTELFNGMQIKYFLPFAGSGNATLNLTFPDLSTSGVKPVYLYGTLFVNTQFPANSVIDMTYSTQNISTGAWYVTGGSVATGVGLTSDNATGAIKANLLSETRLSMQAAPGIEMLNRVYPVALDLNGRLAVNVPWTDTVDLTSMSGALPVANGGTGQTTVAGARNALGLGNTDGAVPIANGGTGAESAEDARTNLGLGSASTHDAETAVANDSNIPTGSAVVAYMSVPINEIMDARTDADDNTYTSLGEHIRLLAKTDSPALTGTPTAPTASVSSNDTQIATTAFVHAAITQYLNGVLGYDH